MGSLSPPVRKSIDGAVIIPVGALITPPGPGEFTVTATDSGVSGDATVEVLDVDDAPPRIEHRPPAKAPAGAALEALASVSDDVKLASVTLTYRPDGAATFTTLPMSSAAPSSFKATVPAADVRAKFIEYYIEAEDAAGNRARSPPGAPSALHKVVVEEEATPPPPRAVPRLDLQTILMVAVAVAIIVGAAAGAAGFARRRRVCRSCGGRHRSGEFCGTFGWSGR